MFNDERVKMKLRNVLLTMMVATMTATSANAMLPTPEVVGETAQQAGVVQTTPAIDVKVHAYVVRTDTMGVDSIQPIRAGDAIGAGDVIEYRALLTNQDANRVRSMTATLGIPEGTELIGAVEPSIVKASIDGERFVNMPIRGMIDGQVQALPLSYYKALRWTIEDVGLGGTAVVKYRVVIK